MEKPLNILSKGENKEAYCAKLFACSTFRALRGFYSFSATITEIFQRIRALE